MVRNHASSAARSASLGFVPALEEREQHLIEHLLGLRALERRRVRHAGLVDVVAEEHDGRARRRNRDALREHVERRLVLRVGVAGIADQDEAMIDRGERGRSDRLMPVVRGPRRCALEAVLMMRAPDAAASR